MIERLAQVLAWLLARRVWSRWLCPEYEVAYYHACQVVEQLAKRTARKQRLGGAP